MPCNPVASLRPAGVLETTVIHFLRASLNDYALRRGGFGPDEAFAVLNPLYWCRCAWYSVRRMTLDTFNKYLGLDRVVVKDEHERECATLTMVRNADGDKFRVICDVRYITKFETFWSSKRYTRRVFDSMRAELWMIESTFEASEKGPDDIDRYLDAIEDYQSRWQRYAVCLV